MTDNIKHPLETCYLVEPTRPSKVAKTTTEDLSEDDQQPESTIDPMSQNPKFQRYLVAIEYIGTRFSGSQQQSNCRTVVGVLEVPLNLFYFIWKSTIYSSTLLDYYNTCCYLLNLYF